jgi:hypothetical protein
MHRQKRLRNHDLFAPSLEVPRDVDYYYSLVALEEEEEELEELDALVVEGVLPPVTYD